MTAPLLEVTDLAHTWSDGRAVLRGVSFALRPGECVALVGPNGAGKSTLLHHLVGLLLPAAGTIRVADIPVTTGTLHAVRRKVGLVLQDPDDQLFLPTVEEDVAFGPRNLGLPAAEVERRVHAALTATGADALRARPPHRLSAGEKRRCALAAVLALEPDLLALDEPSSHLDPRGRRQLLHLLATLPQARLVVTHDLDLAWDLCPRTLVLAEGRLVADGPTHALLADAALMDRAGLEVPSRVAP